VRTAVFGIGALALALATIALGSMIVRDALLQESLARTVTPVVAGWGLVFLGIVLAWIAMRAIGAGRRP
jgi:xanthine/uracil permease